MKFQAILLLCLVSVAICAPLSTSSTDAPSTTAPPVANNPQKLAQNVSQAALASSQAATILLNHVENVILAAYEIPPTTPCFQEEREPSSYEHPHPSTDFQGNLIQGYTSLLSYKDYFENVTESNSQQKKSSPTSSPEERSTPAASPKAIYIIELSDFTTSLSALGLQMERLLNALSPGAVDTAKGETTATPLPSDCFETCYGQQVSALRDYIALAQYYIPSDIGGILNSKKI